MSQSNSKTSTLAAVRWDLAVTRLFFGVFAPYREVFFGMLRGTLPRIGILAASSLIALALVLRLDSKLFHPAFMTTHYWLSVLALLQAPLWIWGALQVVLQMKLRRRLREIFQVAGLKTATGALPGFIFDRPLDEYTRRLRLSRSYLSRAQFESAKPVLESALQVYIDEIREQRERGTIDLIYSHDPMPAVVPFQDWEALSSLQFQVGSNRSRLISSNLRTTPHLLVAGQTNGGKSTFLRQLIVSLYLKNPTMSFTLIDLKGGLEFQLFDELKRVHVIPDVKRASLALVSLEDCLKERMDLLKSARAKDLDAFHALSSDDRKLRLTEGQRSMKLERHLLVIDEAAEMFLAGHHAAGENIQAARRILSQIARQGRAVGIHLVIATQRPDSKSLDPQVKANLPGVICFHMANDASSLTVLGTGRATDLPMIPGRAIWKSGSEMTEIQTPYLSVEQAEELLAPHSSSLETISVKKDVANPGTPAQPTLDGHL